MRVLLIAPPGAGKGTQGVRIAEHFGIAHISSGDLFRDHVARETQLGKAVKRYLDEGDLVPDDLVLAMIGRPVIEAAANGGYVLDGYPRTVDQARAAYRIASELDVQVQAVVNLEVSEEELLRRLSARAIEQGRTDDDEATIKHRLAVYEEKTSPLIDFYARRGILKCVNGEQSVEGVTAEILAILEPLAS